MDHVAFQQARRFAFQDIRREICLARVSETAEGERALRSVGVEPGGGNFMVALALLCYTEFAGKLKFNRKRASDNFNLFFDELGPGYKAFRASGHNVYDTFRCGLAHEYYVKRVVRSPCSDQLPNPALGEELKAGTTSWWMRLLRYICIRMLLPTSLGHV